MLSRQMLAVGFATFSIVLGLFVLHVLRRNGGWNAVGKGLLNLPGACILGGCIAMSWAADELWLASSFVVLAFAGLVVGTYLLVTGRLDSR